MTEPNEEAVLISLTAGQVKRLGRVATWAAPILLASGVGGGFWAVDEVGDRREQAFQQIDSLWTERTRSLIHYDSLFARVIVDVDSIKQAVLRTP